MSANASYSSAAVQNLRAYRLVRTRPKPDRTESAYAISNFLCCLAGAFHIAVAVVVAAVVQCSTAVAAAAVDGVTAPVGPTQSSWRHLLAAPVQLWQIESGTFASVAAGAC